MNNFHIFQVKQSLEDIFNDDINFFKIFFEFKTSLSDYRGQITTLTVLVYSIAIVVCSKILVACDYVGMSELLNYVELLFEKIIYTFSLNCL